MLSRPTRPEPRSAGTFSNKQDANKAWQRAETKIAEGRLSDPRRGRQTFHRYVTEEWLPHHVMEVTTREAYTYQISKHIMPWFGPMRMNEIMPAQRARVGNRPAGQRRDPSHAFRRSGSS